MPKKRNRHRKWVLLFRLEDGQPVHLYEPLSFGEINHRLLKGWKLID
jgi:hypothetical protein